MEIYRLDSGQNTVTHLGILSKFSSVCVTALDAKSGSQFNFDHVSRKELLYGDRLDRQELL